ncbi:MAG: hypothetical protein V3S55_15190 [Nitrospiraceae bacterium]
MRVSNAKTAAGNPSFTSFLAERVILGSTLACPLILFWWDYTEYCKEWGFDRESAVMFVSWLLDQEGVSARNVGKGRFKRCVDGAGMKPKC